MGRKVEQRLIRRTGNTLITCGIGLATRTFLNVGYVRHSPIVFVLDILYALGKVDEIGGFEVGDEALLIIEPSRLISPEDHGLERKRYLVATLFIGVVAGTASTGTARS